MSEGKTQAGKMPLASGRLPRQYSSELAGLPQLQKLAAHHPEDGLPEEEPAGKLMSKITDQALIEHLIEFIKAL